MNNVYSDWQKIDLHIHTDWSKKTKHNDYKGLFSVDGLKEKLHENDVSIFSLTDHNIINIDAYKEYYEQYDQETDPLLLLGVELDIIVDKYDSKYHSLLIFNYSNFEKAKDISNRLETKYDEKGLDIKERELSIEEIVELFPEDDFFFIPHAGNTRSIKNSYSEDIEYAQKMVLLMQSAFEKVKQKAIHIYNENFDKVLEDAFRNKGDYAYIEFSDNHNIANYPCKGKDGENHEFYHVKGGKNFETLRLAFIDPNSRIKSAEELKEINSANNFLTSIKISSGSFLDANEISFSPHLNVIVGGRSSGKSLMMSLIGDKIDCIKNDNSKYQDLDYDIATLKTRRDLEYKDVVSIPNDEIIYIKQGDIVRYFEENKLSDLAKESGKLEEYKSSKENFTIRRQKLEAHLDRVINSYDEYLPIANNRYVLHDSTINDILNDEYIFQCNFESIEDELDWSENIKNSAGTIYRLIKDSKNFLEEELFDFEEKEEELIDDFISLLEKKRDLISEKGTQNQKKLKFWESTRTCLKEVNGELNQEAQDKKESLESLQTLKSQIKGKLLKAKQLKGDIQKLVNFEYNLEESVEINDQVTLKLEVGHLEEGNLKLLMGNGINQFDETNSLFVNLLDVVTEVKGIKNYSENNSDILRKKMEKELEVLLDALNSPRDYLSYQNGGTSKNNSPGYNSEKYLELLLQNPKSKLIFIDQPEDNLGNKFISETLVMLLREIKFDKQIFLITHNPSIVVYGDAENIIIARNEENQISYDQVVLENTEYLKEICSILDGGEYIFNMRSEKYNINRVLKSKNGTSQY